MIFFSGYDSDDDPYEDLNLTDEDSENLISDEEDDKESGFLSQIQPKSTKFSQNQPNLEFIKGQDFKM